MDEFVFFKELVDKSLLLKDYKTELIFGNITFELNGNITTGKYEFYDENDIISEDKRKQLEISINDSFKKIRNKKCFSLYKYLINNNYKCARLLITINNRKDHKNLCRFSTKSFDDDINPTGTTNPNILIIREEQENQIEDENQVFLKTIIDEYVSYYNVIYGNDNKTLYFYLVRPFTDNDNLNGMLYFASSCEIHYQALKELATLLTIKLIDVVLGRMEKEAIKSAKAAIMSRNMSHNLGSHVMFYIKQKLESVNSILREGTLSDLIKETSVEEFKQPVDEKSMRDGNEIYFLVGLGRFINYLQERQDYIATIATDHIPHKSIVNFKDAIYDELKPELKSQRHKDDRSIDGKHAANLLFDYIAFSEGFHPSEKIELWYDGFNGTGKPHNVPDELRGFNIYIPGGTLGRQALFSIMENIIRNTAKHDGAGMSCQNMKFIFQQLTKINRLKAWTNEKYYLQHSVETEKVYHDAKNLRNYFYLGITVDLGVEVDPTAIDNIKKGLNEKYFENGLMNNNSKGIKEIRISAAWMRGFWIDDAIPVNEPPAVAIRKTEDGKLQYIICLPKPKRVAFITEKDTELDNNGCRNFAQKLIEQNDDDKIEEKCKEIADFDLIVCPENLCDSLRKYVGSRILSVSNVEDYTNKDVPDLYLYWLNQQFKEEYPSGSLPTLVINDAKAFENKQENEKWRDDAQAMIDGKKVECNSSETVSDQIVFEKHYNWSERGKKLRKDFYSKAIFIEGISGGNSTDRLIRHDTWDGEWHVKHMAAALTHVAIIDERIYNTFVKKGKSHLQDWDVEKLKEWLQKYKSEIEKRQFPSLFLQDCFEDDFSIDLSEENVNTLLINSDNRWTTTEDTLTLKHFIDTLHDIDVPIDYSSAILFAQKGVCAFNIIPDVNKVTIKGYSPERKEEREVATITYDSKEKKLTTHSEKEFSKKFHFVSIHQGILEKMYESLIKDDNGIKKSDVTRAVFDIFSMAEAVDNDFLPQFIIHSGRSKPSSEYMPQKQPFIQFAALDNAIHDCKYTLTELLYTAHYES